MWALDGAFLAIAAADGFLGDGQLLKMLAAQGELAVALGVGEEAQSILNRQAFGAGAFAIATQPAI